MIVPLKKKHVDFYVEEILDAARLGKGVEVFLYDHEIRRSDWNKYSSKHSKIRRAMEDAEEYCKAVALKRVDSLIKDQNINPTIAKMYLEYNAGWKDTAKDNEFSDEDMATAFKDVAKSLPV